MKLKYLKRFVLLSLQPVLGYWLACLLTQFTCGPSECGQITLTGGHAGKHTRQITQPPMGACHTVTCDPWTPLWVKMKHRGKIKTEFDDPDFSQSLHIINSSILHVSTIGMFTADPTFYTSKKLRNKEINMSITKSHLTFKCRSVINTEILDSGLLLGI